MRTYDSETSVEVAKHLISDLWSDTGLVDTFMIQAWMLEKKDKIKHIICDLDDTLCSRRAQMREEVLLKENRGNAWNTIVFNEIGTHDFIEKYYRDVNIPQDIVSWLTKWNCYILTAWIRILQGLKMEALWLDHLNYRVVPTWRDKILESIYYVLLDLQYIPWIIEVYEDKPHHFLKYRKLIETCLTTKLQIYHVQMVWNQWYKFIREIIEWSDEEQEQIEKSKA